MRGRRSTKPRFNKGVLVRNIIIVIILVAAIFLLINFLNKKDNGNEVTKPSETVSKIKEEPKEETYSASMLMVGDMLIHSSIYKEAARNANNQGYDFKPMIEYIKPFATDADIAYYNQETILGGAEIGLSDYPCFNSPYEAEDLI